MARGAWGCGVSTNIPTPAELLAAERNDHDAEADAVVARIVARLRAYPRGYATEFASMPALRIVAERMTERGWVCEVWNGSAREPDPSITVTAPTGGAR